MKYYFNIRFPLDRSSDLVEYAIGVPAQLVMENLKDQAFQAEAKRRSSSDSFECDAAAVLGERLCREDRSLLAKDWLPKLAAKFFIYPTKPEDLGEPLKGHFASENLGVELWRIKTRTVV